ncbi:MAG: tRNA-intron lyase [Candidatus Bathyarchaeia archaeon]
MKAEKIQAELVENRLVVWDPKEGTELYGVGYYGKPLGIPKPKVIDFKVPLLLDLMEGLYLFEKGKLIIFEKGKRVSKKELIKKAGQIYEEFPLKYAVYRDLREKNLIVQPGIKFGCDFAVYEQGPGIDHAPFLVQVKRRGDKMDAVEIVRAGRLATTVRKRFLIAIPNRKKGVTYLIFKWWKA